MAGRPFTTKKDAQLCYSLHALQTLQQDKLKRPQIMLTFFCPILSKAFIYYPFCLSISRKIRAIPLYDFPETLLKHQL